MLFRDSTSAPTALPGIIHSVHESNLTRHNSSVIGLSPRGSVDLGLVSDSNYRNLSINQYHAMFDKTKEILASRNTSLPFISSGAVILDERFVKLCAPLLDKLPILQLQSTLQGYCMAW